MKTLFNPKKPWLWILVTLVVAAVAVTVFLLCNQPNTTVSAELDACVESILRQVHYSSHTEGKYPTVAYTALDVKEKDDTVTLYGVMMYREYTCTTQSELVLWGSAHFPFAVTAEKKADGTYEATECWWPEDGAESNASIKKKFPFYCEKDAINYQQYFANHDAACRSDAAANITAVERYVVLRPESGAVWLGYRPNSTYGYILSPAGYGADGTYEVAEDGTVRFTFGDRVVTVTNKGREYFYDEKNSQNIPSSWITYRDTEILVDGLRFTDEALGDTVAMGESVVVSGGMSWMEDEEISAMFGYVPDNSSADSPYYLPIMIFSSRDQLDRFIESFGGEGYWKDLKADDFAKFDATYFENNSLVVTYYKDGTYQAKPSVGTYVITEEGTCLSVRLDVEIPNLHDTALGQWLLFSGIQKTDMEEIKVLEAYADNVVKEGEVAVGDHLSFTGKVKQVDGTAVLMECDSVPQFSNGVWVELGNAGLSPVVGETYVVTYEDMVMPSLPPRITAISITKA